ncbi:MAG: chorismate lyase [Gammaproteobacteria bacterium]|nr:chorismate lyase [Gammaproteobacteria bacterium]
MSTFLRQFKRIPHWVVLDCASHLAIPDQTREWLSDSTSLTLRIKQHCLKEQLGCFSVKVLQQGMAQPSKDEVQRLKLNHHYALIREVLLYCGDTPIVFARTVIPINTLSASQHQLACLGNRPLGEFLFAQPALERDAMEITALNQGHQLYDIAVHSLKKSLPQVWARRSIFRLKDKPLLVAEVFLPNLLNKASL